MKKVDLRLDGILARSSNKKNTSLRLSGITKSANAWQSRWIYLSDRLGDINELVFANAVDYTLPTENPNLPFDVERPNAPNTAPCDKYSASFKLRKSGMTRVDGSRTLGNRITVVVKGWKGCW